MKQKILVVDEDQNSLFALKGQLAPIEAEVHCSSSANQALSLLTEHPFSIAVVSVEMQTISGFELARLIHGVRRFKHLPIIFLSNQPPSGQLTLDSYEAGAIDILFHPIHSFVLTSKIEKFLEIDNQHNMLQTKIEEEEILRQKAEMSSKGMSLMFANVTHELRTPLGNIWMLADLLAMNKEFSPSQKDSISKIISNVKELKHIISDVLDQSKIESGKFEINLKHIDIRSLLDEIEEFILKRVNEKGISFRLITDGNVPEIIYSDPIRVKQIINNLLTNAIKFTNSGFTKLHTSIHDDKLIFTVEDSGIGINKKHQKNLFKPFGQAHKNIETQYSSNGLGLALSRDLCRKLGGDLVLLSSKLGDGSKFQANIMLNTKPVKIEALDSQNENQNLPSDLEKTRKTLRGLYIDDIENNLKLTQELLSYADISLELTQSGQTGIELAKTNDFDFILLDIQMPEMNGFEVFKELKKCGCKAPIIALAGHATKDYREKCHQLGFDAFLTKPLLMDQLLKTLKEHTN